LSGPLEAQCTASKQQHNTPNFARDIATVPQINRPAAPSPGSFVLCPAPAFFIAETYVKRPAGHV
jgi:hypothetical protein